MGGVEREVVRSLVMMRSKEGGMNLISFELALLLKDAKLNWDPQLLDFYVFDEAEFEYAVCVIKSYQDIDDLKRLLHMWYPRFIKTIWIPRVDQLKVEIERHGYWWETGLTMTDGLLMHYDPPHKAFYWCELFKNKEMVHRVKAETEEESVANALLWILEQENPKQKCKRSDIGSYECYEQTSFGKSVDCCLVDEINWLNNEGIQTIGCCCGHTLKQGFIQVTPGHVPDMINLGYEQLPIDNDGNGQWCFKPKTILPS